VFASPIYWCEIASSTNVLEHDKGKQHVSSTLPKNSAGARGNEKYVFIKTAANTYNQCCGTGTGTVGTVTF
jgi:hypothetical protein